MMDQPQPKLTPVSVFYSYAHQDEALRNELEKHLSMLRRQGHISEWHDRQISAGTEWAAQIDEHLEAASIILLLISADFLASDYCYSIEMQRAMKRHEAREARVIPIILRPVDWKDAPFATLQALPTDGKPVTDVKYWSTSDHAFSDVAKGIRLIVHELRMLDEAHSYVAERRYEEALEIYDKVLQLYPHSIAAYEGKGDTLSYLKRHQEAAEAYDHAAQKPVLPERAPHAAERVNITKATGVGCEIKLADGSYCGVTALGRCSRCERAICASHDARVFGNYCTSCLAKARADEEKQRQEAQEAAAKYRAKQSEARDYIQSGSARLALLTAGVPPVKIYQIQQKKEKKVTSVWQGWILGPFTRNFASLLGFFGDDLTALLDLDQVVLIRVTPFPDSYLGLEVTNDNLEKGYKIIELAVAVMSLIELKQLGIQSIFTRRLPSMHDNPSRGGQVLAGRSGFLRIEEGEEPGRIYEIHKEEYSIGPNTKSDIYLAKNATVMNLGNGNYALRAEDSEVKINGQELYKHQPYPLQEGDRIQFGQTVLVFGTK